ncbi:MAG: NAD(P)/FAD-dependent oxidoreductase [Desulfobacterales bacterium]|nr:NAD(P)/FAD-dependent oxidoreductase [Desulfobacterales bacterium]MDJ0886853.1 NAD(P)/FAD-dependent oxidoreductase [Desulfobacterales bacterium]MDJ0988838.1 NAD(P)/FAD-dependent oxidoreductase [Desulfobacterales bacterium]
MADVKRNQYDVCVIGCGPGGFAAAMRALDLGKDVCIIEGGEIGGAGVMWGALASKTMWELSRDYSRAAKTGRGYRASGLTMDYQAMRDSVFQAIREKQYQMLSQIESFAPHRYPGPGSVALKRGWASFISSHRVAVELNAGGQEDIQADFFVIATGSTPRAFPGITTDGRRVIDSDTVLNLKAFPKRLLIVGAGVIGCEYATIFSNFGQTQVYLVDYAERIIPYEDDDVSDFISANLEANGVTILHSAILRDILHFDDYLQVILDFDDGHSEVLEVDAALISIGRRPNFDCLRLDKAGILTSSEGYLDSNEACCVHRHIYAAGDVTHRPALVNLAEMEGRFAVKHMYGIDQWPLNYRNMSTVMFFKPAVAAVGLNEKTCQKKGIAYRVAYYANSLLPRAIAMRATKGFIKILVSDDDEQKVLGMRAAGPQASNTIMSIAFLMDQDKGIRDALKSVHPHPTMSEGIQDCLRVLLNKSIFKPHAFPNHIKIRHWHPEKGYHA